MRSAAAHRLLRGRLYAKQRLQATQVPGASVNRGYVTASQLAQQAQGTVVRGADNTWKVTKSFLGGCIAAPFGVLAYYYWQDPAMTEAYLRHRLGRAWEWVGMRPGPGRPEDGGNAAGPRPGRTGLGTLGPRSATPITPFRLFDQHGQLRTDGELVGERSMLLLVHPGPVDERDPAMRRYAAVLQALDKMVKDAGRTLRPVLVAPDVQADERGLTRLKQVIERFERNVRRPGHRMACLLGLAGDDAAKVAQRAAGAGAASAQQSTATGNGSASTLYLVDKQGRVRRQAGLDEEEQEIIDTLLEVVLEEV